MTTEQIEKIVADSEQRIREQVIESTIKGLSDTVSWALKEKIQESVNTYFVEEILPDLRAALVEAKPAVIEAMRKSVVKIGESLGMTLMERAKKNLENSYRSSSIAKELFA